MNKNGNNSGLVKEQDVKFVKYRLTWKFTDDGILQEAFFWLPEGAEPIEHIEDILNIVELSASEYGYEYILEVIDSKACPKCKGDLRIRTLDMGDQVGTMTQVICDSCDFGVVG